MTDAVEPRPPHAISFAQHGEDIVLARALDQSDGFYVDVGAFDPTADSVTRLFYERGWRGVNIDPSAEAIARFDIERPDDVNLALAAGAYDGDITFHVTDVPGWSTTDAGAAAALARGDHVVRRVTVPVRRLSSLLDELPERQVDFLKVDVEGAEADVVAGLDLARHRPRVVVLEGVAPGIENDHSAPALEILQAAGYQHVGFDGLNHYLTCEPALAGPLASPANPTDGFVKFSVAQVEARAAWLDEAVRERDARLEDRDRQLAARDGQLHESVSDLARARAEYAELDARRAQAEKDLRLVLASRSWRLTRPLRGVAQLARGDRPPRGSRVARLDSWLRRWPRLREALVSVAVLNPRLEGALRSQRDGGADHLSLQDLGYDIASARREVALAALFERARLREASR